MLLDALGDYKDYILISSSAVYPEYETQPLLEDSTLAVNKYWGKYGTDKDGLKEAFEWYKNNMDKVSKKPFVEYVDNNLV